MWLLEENKEFVLSGREMGQGHICLTKKNKLLVKFSLSMQKVVHCFEFSLSMPKVAHCFQLMEILSKTF